MEDSLIPEMQRSAVEELCLQVKALRLPGRVHEVLGKAMAAPPLPAVHNALASLRAMGALDHEDKLTPLGWKLAALPMHPALGKLLLLGSLMGCMPGVLSVCAALSGKSPFVLPLGQEREAEAAKTQLGKGLHSDHLLLAKVNEEFQGMGDEDFAEAWCKKNWLSSRTLRMSAASRQDLARHLRTLHFQVADREEAPRSWEEDQRPILMAVLAASLPLALRGPSEKKFRFLEVTHQAGAVHPASLLKHLSAGVNCGKSSKGAELSVLCWFSRLRTTDIFLHDASVIADVLPLLLLAPCVVRREPPQHGIFEVMALRGPLEDASLSPGEQKEESEDSEDEELLWPGVRQGGTAAEAADASARASTAPAEDGKGGGGGPRLLIMVRDNKVADDLWHLRQGLQELISSIIGQPPMRLPKEVHLAFASLGQLLAVSYDLHSDDPGQCCVVKAPTAAASGGRAAAAARDESDESIGADETDSSAEDGWRPQSAPSKGNKGGGKGKGRGKGKGKKRP